jgi:hypothetical protein
MWVCGQIFPSSWHCIVTLLILSKRIVRCVFPLDSSDPVLYIDTALYLNYSTLLYQLLDWTSLAYGTRSNRWSLVCLAKSPFQFTDSLCGKQSHACANAMSQHRVGALRKAAHATSFSLLAALWVCQINPWNLQHPGWATLSRRGCHTWENKWSNANELFHMSIICCCTYAVCHSRCRCSCLAFMHW